MSGSLPDETSTDADCCDNHSAEGDIDMNQNKQNGSTPTPDSSATSPSQAQSTPGNPGTNGSPPSINMGMMFGGVEVTGGSGDDLQDVQETASELMSELAEEVRATHAEMDDGEAGPQGSPQRGVQ